jgi:hypothetical protein
MATQTTKPSVRVYDDEEAANRDPVTGAPGAHPVGVGVGAAGGGVAGAAAGSLGGPVGTAIGAGIGAVVGGLAGKAVAEGIDPTVENAYWRDTYVSRPYVESGADYARYSAAYRYGWESAMQNPGRDFEEVERELESNWPSRRGKSQSTWEEIKDAVRDAWDRVKNRLSS